MSDNQEDWIAVIDCRIQGTSDSKETKTKTTLADTTLPREGVELHLHSIPPSG
jgi:hypothetical protein